MARIRYLKPDFFRDDDLATLPFEVRLFYAGLWCSADKAGRLEDRPVRLKADIFPYDKVDVEKCLNLLGQPKRSSGEPYIQRYAADGQKYIQVVKWDKHQRPHNTEKESEIPQPPPMEKGMGMEKGMENLTGASKELSNGSLTVKQPLNNENRNKTSKNEDFETFWRAYPKKRDKGEAELIFRKLNPSKELLAQMLTAIEAQKQSIDWIKEGGQYIPYPSRWLKRQKWTDQIEVRPAKQPAPACFIDHRPSVQCVDGLCLCVECFAGWQAMGKQFLWGSMSKAEIEKIVEQGKAKR